MKVIFFPNGKTAVFKDGRRVPKLEESWLEPYLHLLAVYGVDPMEVEFVMPDANRAEVIEEKDGSFAWRIVKSLEDSKFGDHTERRDNDAG